MEVFAVGMDGPAVIRTVAAFKRDPDAFLVASSLDEDALVQQGLVAVTNEQIDDTARVHILLLWQEFAALLFHESKRIDKVTTALLALVAREGAGVSLVSQAQVRRRRRYERARAPRTNTHTHTHYLAL